MLRKQEVHHANSCRNSQVSAQDITAEYCHEISIWQCEFSRTQVFDRPMRGREFFESVIRENIDLGRPDRVQLLFDRKIIKSTPGSFRSRVIFASLNPDPGVHVPHPLRCAMDKVNAEIDNLIERAHLKQKKAA